MISNVMRSFSELGLCKCWRHSRGLHITSKERAVVFASITGISLLILTVLFVLSFFIPVNSSFCFFVFLFVCLALVCFALAFYSLVVLKKRKLSGELSLLNEHMKLRKDDLAVWMSDLDDFASQVVEHGLTMSDIINNTSNNLQFEWEFLESKIRLLSLDCASLKEKSEILSANNSLLARELLRAKSISQAFVIKSQRDLETLEIEHTLGKERLKNLRRMLSSLMDNLEMCRRNRTLLRSLEWKGELITKLTRLSRKNGVSKIISSKKEELNLLIAESLSLGAEIMVLQDASKDSDEHITKLNRLKGYIEQSLNNYCHKITNANQLLKEKLTLDLKLEQSIALWESIAEVGELLHRQLTNLLILETQQAFYIAQLLVLKKNTKLQSDSRSELARYNIMFALGEVAAGFPCSEDWLSEDKLQLYRGAREIYRWDNFEFYLKSRLEQSEGKIQNLQEKIKSFEDSREEALEVSDDWLILEETSSGISRVQKNFLLKLESLLQTVMREHKYYLRLVESQNELKQTRSGGKFHSDFSPSEEVVGFSLEQNWKLLKNLIKEDKKQNQESNSCENAVCSD